MKLKELLSNVITFHRLSTYPRCCPLSLCAHTNAFDVNDNELISFVSLTVHRRLGISFTAVRATSRRALSQSLIPLSIAFLSLSLSVARSLALVCPFPFFFFFFVLFDSSILKFHRTLHCRVQVYRQQSSVYVDEREFQTFLSLSSRLERASERKR